MKLNEIEKLKQTDKFYEWWDAVGSAIRRYESQDMQEHSLRVARMAWQDRGLLIENVEHGRGFSRCPLRLDLPFGLLR